MRRLAQAYIAAVVTLFIVFTIMLTMFQPFSPGQLQKDNLEMLLLSLNETVKGCLAYSTYEDLGRYLNSIGSPPANSNEAVDKFSTCISETVKYVSHFYGWIINPVETKYESGRVSSSFVKFVLERGDRKLTVKYSRKVEVAIVNTTLRTDAVDPFIEIVFEVKYLGHPYIYFELYFLEGNGYEKILSGYLLPHGTNLYRAHAGIPLKYLAEPQPDEILFLLVVADNSGGRVWVSDTAKVKG